nr:uncharacterized protein LOC116428908 [Nomia melanderi]
MEAQMKQLIAERGSLKARLTRFKRFMETSASEMHVDALGKKIQAYEDLRDKFDKVQSQIEVIVTGTDSEASHLDERDDFENVFFPLIASAQRHLANLRGPQSPANSPSHASSHAPDAQMIPRMPTILLQNFDGTYNHWVRFRDTYLTMVDNNESLTDIQRFHYLTSALTVSAARIIESLGVSEANYGVAWEALKRRFEDPYTLVHHHVNALLEIPNMHKQTTHAFREFIDHANNQIVALGALGEPVNAWDTIVVTLLSKKLDSITYNDWDTHAENLPHGSRKRLDRATSNHQSAAQVFANQTRQGRASKVHVKTSAVTAHVSSTRNQCVLCEGEHLLQHCGQLKAMPTPKRHETVKHLQSCFNCLRQGHSIKGCTRGTCRKCGKKHNTLLHREDAKQETVSLEAPVETTTSCVSNSASVVTEYTVLSTAIVFIKDRQGRKHECRALLDVGSQANFITEDLRNRLDLPYSHIDAAHKIDSSDLVWQKTRLGWVLDGWVVWLPGANVKETSTCHMATNEQLDRAISQFWEIEDSYPTSTRTTNAADDPSERHFKVTTTRDDDGRYIVKIPFTSKLSDLSKLRTQAENRLLGMERRLAKDPELHRQSCAFMTDYETLGHMTRITDKGVIDERPNYYLSHHAVIKEFSFTTKLRVVFDGSAKSSSGISLNDTQLLKSPSNRWKTFVENRVSRIQQIINSGHWNHVLSPDNPADIILRGASPSALTESHLWWLGPAWLAHWPSVVACPQEIPEARQASTCLTVAHQGNPPSDLFSSYSSYSRLRRITAYCLKFTKAVANKLWKPSSQPSNTQRSSVSSQYLTTCELHDAEMVLIKLAQREQFGLEFTLLSAQKSLTPKSPLLPLNPFLDENGLIRVGSRLKNVPIPYDQRHPMILPAKHPLTALIITCFRANPKGTNYLMGDLPAACVTPARAFSTCGVDYAGPFILKERGRARTTYKSYLCIFVCFATKTVHIELVTDLRARTELNQLCALLINKEHNDRIQRALAQEQIQWHLIPPYSPHFGGLWESAVKSAKQHLKRVIGEQRLTFEELYTILTQVEACLNSRPLHPLSCDPNDLSPLTPGHFLIGVALTAPPQADLLHLNQNRLNRYQLIQYTAQHFWKRWHREHLHELQQRHKWQLDSPDNVKAGELVIIREDNTPPLKWRLGRIADLHPGSDNTSRVVSIKVADGIIKRPVTRVCVLPIEEVQT